MAQRFEKDPDAKLDFMIDWSDFLASGESISASSWYTPTGITEVSTSNTADTATIWVSGGTAGSSYILINRTTTDNSTPRIAERSIIIDIAASAYVVTPTLPTGAVSLVVNRLRSNPEIGTDNIDFIHALINRAVAFIEMYCNIPQFPVDAHGYSKSGASPSTDISGLAENYLEVSINGSGYQRIELDLTGCTTGSAIASHLQTQIRAEDDIAGFDEVTVSYSEDSGFDSYYLIQSGRYGEASAVNISFTEDEKHVAQALKLGWAWGGEEKCGSSYDRQLNEALVALVESLYNRAGIEGMNSVSMLGGLNVSLAEVDPVVKRMLLSRRRLV